MEKERIDYIDVAKGVGLLFVILLHLPNQPDGLTTVNRLAFTSLMPLFFTIGGILYTDSTFFFEKKVWRYLKPYLIVASLTFFLSIAIQRPSPC